MKAKWLVVALGCAVVAGCGKGRAIFNVDVYSFIKGTGSGTRSYAVPPGVSGSVGTTPQKISLPGAGSSIVDTVRAFGTLDLNNTSGSGTIGLDVYLAADAAGTNNPSALAITVPTKTVSGTNVTPDTIGADLSAAVGLTPDTVRLVVTRSPADTLRALTVFFDPDSSQIRLAADVTLRAVVETLTVHLELRGGGFALFAGTRALEVRAGRPGPPQQIAVVYIGPGTNVAALTLAPLDSVLTFGDALRFRVSAKDSGGAPVTAFYVTWRSSDTTVLRVDAAGLARAPQARALVYVRARTPTGIVDSTPVTVIPVPTLLSLVSGAGQRGVVGLALALPFRVRVLAPDGLGVKGIPVLFRALGGLPGLGGVADSLVVSDTGGYAETIATLGTVAGVQGFDARALARASK